MSDINIKVWVSTNIHGSECSTSFEADREWWDKATDEERDAMCMEAVWNMAEWGWEIEA